MTWGLVAVGGATAVGSYLSADAMKDAGQSGADSANYAADLQNEQYLQSRQDLLPYREVATGSGPEYQSLTNDMYKLADTWRRQVNSNTDPAVKRGMAAAFGVADYNDITDEMFVDSLLDPSKQNEHPYWNNLKQEYGAQLSSIDRTRSQFEPEGTGALNTLAEWGPSRVRPGDYLPDTQIPEFDVQGNIVPWEDSSRVPEYDPNVDVYEDPGYKFRRDEMLNAIDRSSAGYGKLLSGNRLEEIMDRTGQMASQEYGAAYGRNLTDYQTERDRERDIYGRDVFSYQQARGAEQDQYGRDLTGYNADVSREAGMYGRGMNLFGVDYQSEADYLNRLAALSNIGQTATNTGIAAGSTAVGNQGNLLMQGANLSAAGDIGAANTYGNALGDIASLYGMSQYNPYPQWNTDYSIPMTSRSY